MPGDIFESSLIDKLEARVAALEEGGGGGTFHLKVMGKTIKNIPSNVNNIFVRLTSSSGTIVLGTTTGNISLNSTSNGLITDEENSHWTSFVFENPGSVLDCESVVSKSFNGAYPWSDERPVLLITNLLDLEHMKTAYATFRNQIFN